MGWPKKNTHMLVYWAWAEIEATFTNHLIVFISPFTMSYKAYPSQAQKYNLAGSPILGF